VGIPQLVEVVDGLGLGLGAPTIGVSTLVAAAVADTLVLAANDARQGATITNDGAASLYLALGFAASLTAWTVKMPPGSYYEVPFGFRGQVRGYWDAATGTARVTEMTP
jgi:hypothetical protein